MFSESLLMLNALSSENIMKSYVRSAVSRCDSSIESLPFPAGICGSRAALMEKMPVDATCQEMELPLPRHQLEGFDRHQLVRIPATRKKLHPQKRCTVCSRKGVRRDSYYHCPACPSQPALCLNRDCFFLYHHQQSLLKKLPHEECERYTEFTACLQAGPKLARMLLEPRETQDHMAVTSNVQSQSLSDKSMLVLLP